MAQIYLRHGARCQEHPHRAATERCDRCGLLFCGECLAPTPRRADGQRDWHCAACAAKVGATTAYWAYQRSFLVRLKRVTPAATRAIVAVAVIALVGTVFAAVTIPGSRLLPRRPAEATDAHLDARCGELSRIRSIGAIGTQAGEDAVNVLAYPQRAAVRMVALDTPAGAPEGSVVTPPISTSTSSAGVQALVDECDAGWQHEGSLTLPITLELDIRRQGSYIQRIALWQDPKAPRDSWVRDFEVLAASGEAGGAFIPITLDRPGQLRETVEPQWFEIVRPAPGGLSASFPDVIEMRRLQLRVLSTYATAQGSARSRGTVERVALGEVAAYGPDVEILVDHPTDQSGKNRSAFTFKPFVINALAGRPKFVLFFNRTTTAEPHHIVSVSQQRNLDVQLKPDETRSGQFIAGRPGVYEFYCRTPGHAQLGLTGTIVVR